MKRPASRNSLRATSRRLASWTALLVGAACSRQSGSGGRNTSATASAPVARSASASSVASIPDATVARAPGLRARTPVEPTVLLNLPTSAYSASLKVDDDAIYLLTSSTAYRIVPGDRVSTAPRCKACSRSPRRRTNERI